MLCLHPTYLADQRQLVEGAEKLLRMRVCCAARCWMRGTRWGRGAGTWSSICARTRGTSTCCCCSTNATWCARRALPRRIWHRQDCRIVDRFHRMCHILLLLRASSLMMCQRFRSWLTPRTVSLGCKSPQPCPQRCASPFNLLLATCLLSIWEQCQICQRLEDVSQSP